MNAPTAIPSPKAVPPYKHTPLFPLGKDKTPYRKISSDGVRVEIDGRWLLNFSGNDYLGLSQHFAVVDALQSAASRDGVGSGASHLVSGHHAIHDQLEKEMADWLGAPRALLFGSGYLANLAVLQSLLTEDDVCVQDRLSSSAADQSCVASR